MELPIRVGVHHTDFRLSAHSLHPLDIRNHTRTYYLLGHLPHTHRHTIVVIGLDAHLRRVLLLAVLELHQVMLLLLRYT